MLILERINKYTEDWHHVSMYDQDIGTLSIWISENLDKDSYFLFGTHRDVFFENIEDAMAFKLRWS